jgi:hypothetical protein
MLVLEKTNKLILIRRHICRLSVKVLVSSLIPLHVLLQSSAMEANIYSYPLSGSCTKGNNKTDNISDTAQRCT